MKNCKASKKADEHAAVKKFNRTDMTSRKAWKNWMWSTSNESRNNFLNDIWYFVDDNRRKKECFSGSQWAWKNIQKLNDFWYEKKVLDQSPFHVYFLTFCIYLCNTPPPPCWVFTNTKNFYCLLMTNDDWLVFWDKCIWHRS